MTRCIPLLFYLATAATALSQSVDVKAQRMEAKERAAQVSGIDRVLSREMPEALRALPVFGEIIWKVKALPFIAEGPHGGISGAGMVVVRGKIYLAGGFIPAGDGTDDLAHRTSRWAHVFDPATET